MNDNTEKIIIPLYSIEGTSAAWKEDKIFDTDEPKLTELKTRAQTGRDARKASYLGVLEDYIRFDDKDLTTNLWVSVNNAINTRRIIEA